MAASIYEGLIINGYLKKGQLTDKYFEDKKNSQIEIAEEAADCAEDVIAIIDSVYNPRAFMPENARANNVELTIDPDKQAMPEFQKLWARINQRTAYVVDFDPAELIRKAIAALDAHLRVSKIYFKIETGSMASIESKEALSQGSAFTKHKGEARETRITANSGTKYDLIAKIVEGTGLTRKDAVAILQGIQPHVFAQFADNPEEFIIKACDIINDEKATVIIQHITYNKLNAVYGGRTRLVGILLGRGLDIDEARAELNGVTLESLVVASRVARAVRIRAERGDVSVKDFPLLMHIDDILTRHAQVEIPWEDFTFVNKV